ncbi:MAG: gamma-glutamyl hercynylcysteine S-oxide synthase, partial [Thermoleophilaceae bacterium]|nr:gamma-glutamyl hercynylcysteine S-oxide synthase [Thermoleophilaceae bacterium]
MPAFNPVTVPLGGAEPLLGSWIRILLSEARERTLWLVQSVNDDDLERVHDPLMSPLVWDLGHIAAFEDLWLCGHVGGGPSLRPDLLAVYDAAETPRAD